VAGEPIEDGAVLVTGCAIAAVGRADEVVAPEGVEVRDLGEVALLPGLVNAHSHLELTVMRGLLEDLPFRDWIARLTDVKLNRLDTGDLLDSSRLGALEAVSSGITCLGDTCDTGLALDALREAGLRGVVFQETFGPDQAQAGESTRKLIDKVAALEERAGRDGRVRVGVSPHAPYTVSAELFGRVARLALDRGLPVAIHAAESEAEERFVRAGEGPFAEGLARRGISWEAPGRSTISYLAALGVLETRPLLVHAVRATEEDLELVAEAGARIAHCPKSNAKFGHGVAPLAAMLARGITVGLGTDSVVSNNVCDMLDELRAAALFARAAARDAKALGARRALELATLGGARALGLDGEVGTLEPGKRADLCAVSLAGLHAQPVYDPETAVVFSASARDVALTVADGRVVFDRAAPERFPTLDARRLGARLAEIRRKAEPSQ
jgi:5-methylthioadenosine/S-adenosylhomocysteine deaminase